MSTTPKLRIEMLPVEALKEYEGNARQHGETDITAIKKSIEQFGFNDPIGIWGDNIIVEGHGRLMAAKDLGMTEVPVIRLDHLTEEERRAYGLAHNKTAELSGWHPEKLDLELAGIREIDMSALGFRSITEADWYENKDRLRKEREEEDEEYQKFLEKFDIKKTTDDCFTPDVIYDAVADYVAERYKVDRADFVRPFYPGGDYQAYKYKEGAVVVDNPPFSIFSEIVRFYIDRGIPFFLFAPSLVIFNYAPLATAITLQASIIYENGANVSTSFLTNMDDSEICARTDPELYRRITDANKETQKALHKELPKYLYPDHVVTAAIMGRWSKYGVDQVFRRESVKMISGLDEQKESGKAIYGKGLLLSERAAAERAAAERAAAERAAAQKWQLSDRELEIVRALK